MVPIRIAYRQVLWLLALLVLATGCAQTVAQEQLSQESLGMGIVSGTLGEQKRLGLSTGTCPPHR
jgi:hypothetical protein